MMRGTESHLGLQLLPQILPKMGNELWPSVTVNDLLQLGAGEDMLET